jgi:hypothetical protein
MVRRLVILLTALAQLLMPGVSGIAAFSATGASDCYCSLLPRITAISCCDEVSESERGTESASEACCCCPERDLCECGEYTKPDERLPSAPRANLSTFASFQPTDMALPIFARREAANVAAFSRPIIFQGVSIQQRLCVWRT